MTFNYQDIVGLLNLSKRYCPVCGLEVGTGQVTCNRDGERIASARKQLWNRKQTKKKKRKQ